MDCLIPKQNFQSLSVKDLLEARDLYHNHLLHKQNVVGTAIGLYLIRSDDPWPTDTLRHGQHDTKPTRAARDERRFDNSEVRPYSWPCVLVLVREWASATAFGGGTNALRAEDMVPKTLYLPDGRIVPVCVVKVVPGEAAQTVLPTWHWPERLFGGGMPIVVEAQGEEHRATAGCLVFDGHTTYALTNRHVCGAAGEPIYIISRGKKTRIGRASDKQLTRLPFSDVYAAYQAKQTYLTLDIGLIELDDLTQWTSQVYGLGEVGPMADLSELNITLQLIDAKVMGHGAASGQVEGQIKALFYRYKSVGGQEYVSDFLIAPDAGTDGQTQHGDSGMIWHLERENPSDHPLPLAVEWGAQTFLENGVTTHSHFALATSLSNVCKLLDVEVVRTHNTGVQPYWGQDGHYTIAAFACDAVQSKKLESLMTLNRDRISFDIGELNPKAIAKVLKDAKATDGFIPLADVPDIIWKNMPGKVPGGRDDRVAGAGRSTGPEHPTHFADIDEPRPNDGMTLRALSLKNPRNLTVEFWQSFYDALGHTQQNKRGLLPFRVWQFYDAMVEFVRQEELDKFVCAAGIVAHYVGDACQPLHGSILADGYADRPTTTTHHRRDTGETYEQTSNAGAGVHSAYESNMIDRYASEIVDGVTQAMAKTPARPPAPLTNGQEVAMAVVALMDRSAKRVPPKSLVDTFIAAGGKNTVVVLDTLWKHFGPETVELMTDGTRTLALIWESAWMAGKGDRMKQTALRAFATKELSQYYLDPAFIPSLDLDHIGAVLTPTEGVAEGEGKAVRQAPAKGGREPALPQTR